MEHERGVEVGLEAGEQRGRAVGPRLPDELAVVGRGDGAEQRQSRPDVRAAADRYPSQAQPLAIGVLGRET